MFSHPDFDPLRRNRVAEVRNLTSLLQQPFHILAYSALGPAYVHWPCGSHGGVGGGVTLLCNPPCAFGRGVATLVAR
jgi:hypothetical protein